MKKKRKNNPAINTSSTADIAFLLLVFFLVTSVIDSDHGIKSSIAKPFNLPDSVQLQHHNLLLNSSGEILINDKKFTYNNMIPALVNQFGTSAGVKQAVILKTESDVSYELFIQALDKVKKSFKTYHNNMAMNDYGRKMNLLTNKEKSRIIKRYPVVIAEEVLEL